MVLNNKIFFQCSSLRPKVWKSLRKLYFIQILLILFQYYHFFFQSFIVILCQLVSLWVNLNKKPKPKPKYRMLIQISMSFQDYQYLHYTTYFCQLNQTYYRTLDKSNKKYICQLDLSHCKEVDNAMSREKVEDLQTHIQA